ncbi:hypothetical protein KO465_00975 [Candidatus Micrarchaeota archaeon]|nr:hypothetical protein [Candidatus Micrarchaeota archaeon]
MNFGKFTIVCIFIIFMLISLNLAIQKCGQTSDCREGYCEENICMLPEVEKYSKEPCEFTSDCREGYCEQGICVLPVSEDLAGLLWLKSGCSGLFRCPHDDIFCFIGCNMLWLILVVMGITAGYSSKGYENKLIPFIYFVVPIIVGILSVATLGILLAVLEIGIIRYGGIKEVQKKLVESFEYTDYMPKTKKKKKKK